MIRPKEASARKGTRRPVLAGLFALTAAASLGLVDLAAADPAQACVRGTRDVTLSYARASTSTSGCTAEGRSWAYHGSASESTGWHQVSTTAYAASSRGATPRFADYSFR
ncbi:hypothetical protein H4W79_004958 [Nocardiopsis terrae]|uniref:Peptidase inhibitor family I36 n=1 Tax=Nocardiopsis terrae TaxID=372655 RepID=A0ABR9HP00_9ACTN|nr:hypothetical protein [Nocardiopsis terrae]MBE1460744.1 hypothetical protein [Nocardiopsis terrae]